MRSTFLKLGELSKRFIANKSANISILFAFSAIAILIGAGAAIDLARAYSAKQKLIETAILACQYANRPSVSSASTESGSGPSYSSMVNSYIASVLQTEHFQYATGGTQFTYTANGPGTVNLTSSVPTTFAQILKINFIPISATSHCYDTAPSSTYAVFEGFENTLCTGTCYAWYPTGQGTQVTNVWGAGSTVTTSNSTPSSTIGYIGSGGVQWVIMGYCVEIDAVYTILSTVPQGTHSAELDCDNGSGTAGNSSISTKTYLAAGNYELRYNYASRVDYPDYDPVYICGSAASDVSWANDTNAWDPGASNPLRTNQINVYLDANVSGVPTTHKTMDGTQTLGGTNLIDMCVYANGWIDRSVRIKITTAGYYWLSFAADGQNDSYGGQLDNIRLCYNTCTTTPPETLDNFPSTWLAANNGGSNKVLFEDTFESPIYFAVGSPKYTNAGNLALSYGTSGASSGWPSLAASGWAVAPYNEAVYWMQGATQGNQYVSLQGSNAYSNSSDPINRAVSRQFLLDPGYYNISYNYVSLVDFRYDFVYNNGYYPICTASPGSPPNSTLFGMKRGYDYASTTLLSQYLSTNFLSVYMSNGQQVSTPITNSTLGGAPTYNNPDGTVTSVPKVPADGGSIYAAYNSSVSGVLDLCQYSQGYGWVSRSVNVKIQKPGYYWLTFSAQGDPLTGTGDGPAIDDVKLTALGSLYMTNPPTMYLTTIPVPNPQPAPYTASVSSVSPTSIISYTGFFIVGDPLIAPELTQ